jgi:hypothetical protein
MESLIVKIIAILIQIESGGDARAVGDGGRAVGILQMWPVAVAEANRVERIIAKVEKRPARKWNLNDRLDPIKSTEMCAITLQWHWRRGVRDPVRLACKWNHPTKVFPVYEKKVRKQLEKPK